MSRGKYTIYGDIFLCHAVSKYTIYGDIFLCHAVNIQFTEIYSYVTR